MESALGCFDPNINQISVKADLPEFMKDLVHAHECGHYYIQFGTPETLEALEGQGNEHLNKEALATSFYSRQKFSGVATAAEENYWQKNSGFRDYLVNLINSLIARVASRK
jgi:hypothetical protein